MSAGGGGTAALAETVVNAGTARWGRNDLLGPISEHWLVCCVCRKFCSQSTDDERSLDKTLQISNQATDY